MLSLLPKDTLLRTYFSIFHFSTIRLDSLYIGLQRLTLLSVISALVALLFPNKTDDAFANYHTWKAVGFTITFVYSNFLCVSTKLIVAMGLLVAAMILYSVVEIRVRQKQGRNNKPALEGNE